ncbi:MAG: hypothetical protein ACRDRH_29900 [Pseudonocardia sp.]
MFPLLFRRTAATTFAVLAVTLGGLTACGGQGSGTDCGLDGCTITFPRSGDATVSVLGIEARLVGVEAGNAQLEVAGQTITVPVGGEAAAEGFTVRVERVTDTEVVVRISP